MASESNTGRPHPSTAGNPSARRASASDGTAPPSGDWAVLQPDKNVSAGRLGTASAISAAETHAASPVGDSVRNRGPSGVWSACPVRWRTSKYPSG